MDIYILKAEEMFLRYTFTALMLLLAKDSPDKLNLNSFLH